jgi:ATP-dependent helicase/nuclease subunit A
MTQLSLYDDAMPSTSLDVTAMRGRALTDEQEQAVARRTEPLMLAAGAGSGKTSVLVERFVRAVLEDGVAPGKILAITFTERAAGELRERVRARLKELGEREAARDTEAAFVSTFHGFCARLLRGHPLAAGLDPEFVILDEGLAGRLRGQAWANALGGFLEDERGEAVDLVAAWGADRVRAMVEGTYAELRSKGQRLPRLPAIFQLTLPVPVSQARAPELSPCEETCEEMHPEQPPEGSAPDGSPPAGSAPDGSAPAGSAPAGSAPDEFAPTGPTPDGDAMAQESVEITAEGSQACALLAELLERFGHAYTALKKARGAVDFDDLELDARALLDGHESVRRAWAERFELMMVDEFQDTNPRQLAILSALERENLFTVGDELQSIYGFRHADVSLFRARRDELAERGGSLSLTRNFRSRKPLLDAVNAVFEERFVDRYTPLQAGRVEPAMTGDGGDTANVVRSCADEPIVELLLTHKRGWDEDERIAEILAGDLPPAPRWRQAEARLLAQRVAELVDSGATKPGEVAVLLRAIGDLEVYERALQERGLNTLATVGGFWGGQQVGDLVAYLGALANPLDELALYGTLASPLVGVSSDGLALLSAAAKASKRGVWETLGRIEEKGSPAAGRSVEILPSLSASAVGLPTDPMLAVDPSLDRLSSADRTLLVTFHERFEAERAAAGQRTISRLIERALDASEYLERVLSLSWPERRLANVHKLLRVARRYEASEGRDLRGFLDHVAHQQDVLSGAEPDAPVADGEFDAVRLMSIHAAKGLEFGVVCVADLGRAQNLGVGDLLVDGDRVGLRLARLDGSGGEPSLAWGELAEERKQAQVEEEDRILYVAMTRARERLLLSGAVDLERWPEQKLGAPSISWLGPALLPELPANVQTLHPPVRQLDVEVRDGTQVRVGLWLNAPETVGTVLRLDGLDETPSTGVADPSTPTHVNTTATAEEKEQQQTSSSPGETTREPTWPGDHSRCAGPLEAPIRLDDSMRPDTLSYTSLTELARCGYRFYLERVLHLPEQRPLTRAEDGPQADGLEARLRGTIVHRLLEAVDFASSTGPSAADVAKVAHELDVRVSRSEREELTALLRSALDTPLAARLSALARAARREHPFAFSLGEPSGSGEPLLLTGVIDLLARESSGGGLLVVDYKSDRVSADEDLEALLEREYAIQRLLYALAVLSDGAPRVEVIHWFLHRPSEPVSAVFTSSDKPHLEDTIAALVKNAGVHAFIVSKNPHRDLCLTCPGRSGLCSWSDSDTLRERVGA